MARIMKRHKIKIITGSIVLIICIVLLFRIGRAAFDPFTDTYSPVLFDRNGRLLCATVSGTEQWFFPPGKTPDKFKKALIAFEDKRFYYHFGIDPIAIARALRSNFRSSRIVSGASTITMQTIRLSRQGKPRTVPEKITEAVRAIGLEMIFTKAEILDMYAAHAPFGGNVIGLEAAAQRYFGRNAAELSWAEAAMLAVLPNSPSLIHLERNRDKLLQKRNRLLRRLLENQSITPSEYERALWEPLPEKPVEFPQHAYHLANKQQGTSTLDLTLQKRAEEITDRYGREYADNFIYNIAVVIADVEKNEILAYIGNTPYLHNRHNGYVDAASAPRSTGSILKPVLYAAMMSEGSLLPHTLVSDTPLNINGFTPQNYNRTFQGVVPASQAVRHSLNVPLVRMINRYGLGRFKVMLQQLGLSTLNRTESDYGSTLILGGAEGKLIEITGMYASLARFLNAYDKARGQNDSLLLTEFVRPLSSVPDSLRKTGSVRLSKQKHLSLSPAALWYMFDCMSGVNRPEEEASWQMFNSSRQIAWKTGTSYGGRDAWAVGVTPEYAVGVWVGNATGQGRASLTGVGNAAPLLFELFALLPRTTWFDKPYNDMKPALICRKSGHLAGPYCEPIDSCYIPVAGISSRLCPYHKQIHIETDSSSNTRTPVNVFVLSPAQEWYYASANPDYVPIPQEYLTQGIINPIESIYPEWGTRIIVPRGRDGQPERIIFRAAHSQPETTLYWHIDNEYIAATQKDHSLSVLPETGEHYLTLVDEYGNRKSILFYVQTSYQK